MSRNVANHRKEMQPITELKALARQQSQSRTLQKLGSSAIRLAVVEGYLEVPIPDVFAATPEGAAFVEIEAPDADTIMVGSLLYSSYLVVYYTSTGGIGNVYPLDTSNAGWGGVDWQVWLPHSISEDDPAYTQAEYFDEVDAHRLPNNRIRIGAKLTLQQGAWTTDQISMIVLYQLRMTIGWQ